MTIDVASPDERPGPLAGRRVLVARAAHQQGRLSALLAGLGAIPVEVPLLAIDAPEDGGAALRAAVADLAAGHVRVVGLTSPNGVAAVAAAAADVPGAPSALATAWVGCVGPGTAGRFHDLVGRAPDLVAPVHTTAGLGEAFPAPDGLGTDRVLLLRADLASPGLPRALRRDGWQVDDVTAYRTRLVTDLPDDVVEDLVTGAIDAVAAGSPSTVDALVEALDGAVLDADHGAKLVAIGPVTATRARDLGVAVAAQADPHDIDGLVRAVVDALAHPVA